MDMGSIKQDLESILLKKDSSKTTPPTLPKPAPNPKSAPPTLPKPNPKFGPQTMRPKPSSHPKCPNKPERTTSLPRPKRPETIYETFAMGDVEAVELPTHIMHEDRESPKKVQPLKTEVKSASPTTVLKSGGHDVLKPSATSKILTAALYSTFAAILAAKIESFCNLEALKTSDTIYLSYYDIEQARIAFSHMEAAERVVIDTRNIEAEYRAVEGVLNEMKNILYHHRNMEQCSATLKSDITAILQAMDLALKPLFSLSPMVRRVSHPDGGLDRTFVVLLRQLEEHQDIDYSWVELFINLRNKTHSWKSEREEQSSGLCQLKKLKIALHALEETLQPPQHLSIKSLSFSETDIEIERQECSLFEDTLEPENGFSEDTKPGKGEFSYILLNHLTSSALKFFFRSFRFKNEMKHLDIGINSVKELAGVPFEHVLALKELTLFFNQDSRSKFQTLNKEESLESLSGLIKRTENYLCIPYSIIEEMESPSLKSSLKRLDITELAVGLLILLPPSYKMRELATHSLTNLNLIFGSLVDIITIEAVEVALAWTAVWQKTVSKVCLQFPYAYKESPSTVNKIRDMQSRFPGIKSLSIYRNIIW
ncbi:hypothetical protein NEDG_01323 [Nematocida displodere]|uniref:Uncharacterized protein n=1 Tax=Nematocida displodere TaxID=1805483 RepID=A0A177ECY5_9MICR|nr:hypothetical protein NEDG_01323 [Nematocida displodere]